MTDRWNGDKQDLVKWGVLLNLATDHAAGRILQVTYFRPSEWPPVDIDGKDASIPEMVLRHFRDVRTVTAISTTPRIEVVDTPSDDYFLYELPF